MAGPINLAADVDIRFINLDSGRTSDERRAKITGMLDGAGLQYRKFNAVDGRRGDFKIGDYGDYLTTWWLPALPFHPIHTDIVMIDLLKYDFDDKFHDVKYSCYFESQKTVPAVYLGILGTVLPRQLCLM